MTHSRMHRSNVANSLLRRIANSRAGVVWSMVVLLIGSALLAAAVRAYNHATLNGLTVARPSTALPLVQSGVAPRLGRLLTRLSSQPQADRLRHRLGQRFVGKGREQSILAGTLTIGADRILVRIVRTQNEDGEDVQIALNGGPVSLAWTAKQGALSANPSPTAVERSLVERLALDSPDQFILAQLRGASYYTVARQVVPEEALQSQGYSGPAWDVVRVDEPTRIGLTKPESSWRMYYVNSETGLLERIISSEQGQPIMAELLEWSNRQGELAPGRIRWSRNGQVIMELVLTASAYGSR
ncbi:MAG: hypothetical protein AABN34_22730 [Acidobacteriota bacterium]